MFNWKGSCKVSIYLYEVIYEIKYLFFTSLSWIFKFCLINRQMNISKEASADSNYFTLFSNMKWWSTSNEPSRTTADQIPNCRNDNIREITKKQNKRGRDAGFLLL